MSSEDKKECMLRMAVPLEKDNLYVLVWQREALLMVSFWDRCSRCGRSMVRYENEEKAWIDGD